MSAPQSGHRPTVALSIMGPAQIQNLWGAAHRAVRSIFVRLRPDALARALEQVVYVATEIATERFVTSRERNRQRTPGTLRSANKSVRFEMYRYQQGLS